MRPRAHAAAVAAATLLTATAVTLSSQAATASTQRHAPAAHAPLRPLHARQAEVAAIAAARSMPGSAVQLAATERRALGIDPAASAADGTAIEPNCAFSEGVGFASSGGTAPAAISLNKENFAQLVPAGDLDGQGGPDVFDYRMGASHRTINAAVTARSGTTGASLWSRELPGTKDSLTIPFPDPDLVGADGTPGVLLVEQSLPLFSDTSTITLRVRALDGAGNLLWSRTMSGKDIISGHRETLTDVPIVMGHIHNVDEPGHNLLVDVLNGTFNIRTGNGQGSDQPEVLAAANGSVTPLGPIAASTVDIPQALPVPDLSGDGLDDLAITNPGASVSAERGDTGAVVWTSTDVAVDAGAVALPIGDVSSSDGIGDLALANDAQTATGRDRQTISLIDGATGSGLWTHRADCPYRIDGVGASDRPAVGLVTGSAGPIGSRSGLAGVTVAPRYATGRVAFRRTVRVRVKPRHPAPSGDASLDVGTFGDVQPDGAQDLLVRMAVKVGHRSRRDRGVLSGRTGRLVRQHLGVAADGSLVQGDGTDMLITHHTAHGVRLAGVDAATGAPLYRRHVASSGGMRPELAYGIRVTGHDCSDVSMSAISGTSLLVSLLDGAGDSLWSVTSTADALRGGTVHPGATPATYCAQPPQ
jgi:hypothetical protein